MRRNACLSDEVLTAFNLGDLPEALLDSVREHQESCPRCERRARRLDDQVDAVIEDLRASLEWIGPGSPSGLDEEGPGGRGDDLSARRCEATASVEGHCLNLPDYDVGVSPLGVGGMGVVFKARHLKLDRVVALKMIAARSSQAPELFEIEAKAVAQLQHPNIVQIFEIGRHEGQSYLSFEFVEGGTLEERIAGKPQPPRASAELIRTLALAIDYAHRRGIVHCDLKPSNILITPEGVPKIADFGVAKWIRSGDHRGLEGHIIGTPRYMAPEQAIGRGHRVGPAVDIYSLGVILYEMLTGRNPHDSSISVDTPTPACEQGPVPPRRLQPGLSRDLETIVLRCLRKEPAERYVTAEALAEDLERYLTGKAIAARPVDVVVRSYLWAKRHWAVVGLLALAALWLATIGLFSWQARVRLRRYETELRNASTAVPNTLPGNHPDTVAQDPDGSIRLTGATAAIYGNSLVVEAPYGNLGYWHTGRDRAVWTIRVDRPAIYTISLEYACLDRFAGNTYEICAGKTTIRRTVVGTGSWADYRSISLGELTLPAGVHQLEVRAAAPVRDVLFDLRGITLNPR